MASSQQSEFRVYEIQTLKKHNDMEADRLLKAIAAQVQPIMRNRQWKVTVLKEFFPNNPGLLGLNVNGGEEICIRLRPSFDEKSFLPYEELLGTMLHELVHNEHGPHDKVFHKLLDQITEECEDLMAKGVTDRPDKFYGHGVTLGGSGMVSLGNADVAKRAGEKALQRQQRSGLTSHPQALGRILGMDKVDYRNFSPAQMAMMAAERRQQESLWCGVSTETRHPPPKAPTPAGEGSSLRRKRSLPLDQPQAAAGGAGGKDKQRKIEKAGAGWLCPTCTLINQAEWLQCDACGEVKVLI